MELGRLVLDQQYNLPFGVAVSVAVHPHPKQTFPYTYRLSSVRAKVSQNDCFELLAWKMGFGKGMTTNQKAGSSNLSGRAIKSITYRVFGSGTNRPSIAWDIIRTAFAAALVLVISLQRY